MLQYVKKRGYLIMNAILSYNEQKTRKQIQIPYYELQNVVKEIYEKDKGIVDFDFNAFESKYTYFKPYFDYVLLQKQGRLDSFLMNPKSSIYGNSDGTLSYYSSQTNRTHKDTNVITYPRSDDTSVMLNQENKNYASILLADATSLSQNEAKKHDVIIELYMHHILSQNKKIASHYKNWVNDNHEESIFGINGGYSSLYLGVIRYVEHESEPVVYYTKNKQIQTESQTNWLLKKELTYICYNFHMNQREANRSKQFIKSFS